MPARPWGALRAVRLLLPALVPSWNFFDVVAPSPRVQYALTDTPEATPADWTEFRPRPAHVPVATMLRRLLWNSRWNDSLFVMSCAERLVDHPTAHSEDEIFRRIAADLARAPDAAGLPPILRFRLVFVSRDGETLNRETLYEAAPRRRAGIAAA